MKSRDGKSQRRAEKGERRSKKRKSQKKEDPGARKGGKVAKHCVFPMICGSGGSKSRLAKAAGAEPCRQMRDEKLHAVVARSAFRSQTVKNTAGSDHFWKLRCPKSVRRCGAKHISKSKCTKHLSFGVLVEVAMSKKCSARRSGAKHISKSKVENTEGFGALWSFCKTRGFCSSSKNDGRRGTFEEDLQRCTSQYKRHVHQRC